MNIKLRKATISDAELIHKMQILSFKELLDKYQDFETNPGAESIDKVIARINQQKSQYYIIKDENTPIGAIRIVIKENGKICRVSPVFIISDYQNKGIG